MESMRVTLPVTLHEWAAGLVFGLLTALALVGGGDSSIHDAAAVAAISPRT
jgi:hypothetical protein